MSLGPRRLLLLKELRSVSVECVVSAAVADSICWEFIHMDPMIQQMGKTKEQVIEMMRSCPFEDKLLFGPVGSLSGGWRMRLALSRAMLRPRGACVWAGWVWRRAGRRRAGRRRAGRRRARDVRARIGRRVRMM